jgi:hypothetical protein
MATTPDGPEQRNEVEPAAIVEQPEPATATQAAMYGTSMDKPFEISPFIQVGRSGLKQFGGFVFEEFLSNLQNPRGAQAYREIIDNSALVGGIFRLIDLSIRGISKYVEPYHDQGEEATDEDHERAERVEGALEDMSHSWQDTISEIASMILYGYAPMELVYKKCSGWTDDPGTRSRFDDGLITWRKIALRGQDTLFRWEFDDEGGVKAMIQLPPPDYQMRRIPIEKLLLFRPRVEKDNPEGTSVLRSAYFNWYMIKRMTELEAIRGERDATGVPVMEIPAVNMGASATAAQLAVYTMAKKIVKNIRLDEQSGIVIPQAYDPVTKQPLFKLSLLGVQGATTIFDFDKVITRHETRLAISMLADGLLLGHDKVGSFALSKDKTKNTIGTALNAWMDSICAVFNRHAFPRLYALNGWPMDRMCKLGHGEAQDKDLESLAHAVQMLSQAGMPIFPDEQLENHIREEAGWPERSEEALAEQQEQQAYEMEMRQATLAAMANPDAKPAGGGGGAFGKPGKPSSAGGGKPTRGQMKPPQKQPGQKEPLKKYHRAQPRNTRGKWSPPSGVVGEALSILRDRQAVGANDQVAHGFKIADPVPFDPKAMTIAMNVDAMPLKHVAIKDLVATQPSVRRDSVRAFMENPAAVAPGQRSMSGQLIDRPLVVERAGKYYIADGHHRLAAKRLLGYPDALVRVVEEGAQPELPFDQGQPYNIGR